MAKELPYFKFFISEWIAGDITMCDYDVQGLFINICSHYWNKNCEMSLANVKQRFSNCLEGIEKLIFMDIIKLDKEENIIINFLDEQLEEFNELSAKRAKAGAIGGKAKAKQKPSKSQAKAKQKGSKPKALREDKIREDIYSKNYFVDDEVNKKFIEYLELRKKEKLSNSETVIKRLEKKVREYAGKSKDKAIEVIEKAITSKWKDFYPLKN